jgi:hypothetical protein
VLTAQQQRVVRAWVRLRASNAALARSFNASLAASHGLTVNDFEVLRRLSLEDEGRMRRVDLAQVVSLTPVGHHAAAGRAGGGRARRQGRVHV